MKYYRIIKLFHALLLGFVYIYIYIYIYMQFRDYNIVLVTGHRSSRVSIFVLLQ